MSVFPNKNDSCPPHTQTVHMTLCVHVWGGRLALTNWFPYVCCCMCVGGGSHSQTGSRMCVAVCVWREAHTHKLAPICLCREAHTKKLFTLVPVCVLLHACVCVEGKQLLTLVEGWSSSVVALLSFTLHSTCTNTHTHTHTHGIA